MSFNELYRIRQDCLPDYVKRTDIVSAVEQVSSQKIFHFLTGKLTTEVVRGAFIKPGQSNKLPENIRDCVCIAIARDNNNCWRRMVLIKECMHIFDRDVELTNTGDDCEDLLQEFVVSELSSRSQQMAAEIRAIWMALAMFCKESERAILSRKLSNGEITQQQVAEMLKMPLQYVPFLFGDRYKDNISHILSVC